MAVRLESVFVLLFLVSSVTMVFAKNVETSPAIRTKRTTSCDNVAQFFRYKNITVTASNVKGSVCDSECCDKATEDLLRKQGQKDFATLLRHNSRTVQGLLSFTSDRIQSHFSDLSRQSENKTLILFSQVYKGMAVLSKDSIRDLYSDVRSYFLNRTQTEPSVDIKASVNKFFTNFFPLAYHNIIHLNESLDFTPEYKDCLRKSMESISPFGEHPAEITQSLAKSLEAIRLLLEAFSIGEEVLNSTDSLLVDETGKTNGECHQALLKMNHCPKCKGLIKHSKPCVGYCLNVLRGCLTRYVAELDSPWNGYVEGIESLINAVKRNREDAGVTAEAAVKSLDSKISNALMRAIQKMEDIIIKVERICGRPSFHNRSTFPDLEMVNLPTAKSRSAQRFSSTTVDTNLLHFLTSISKSRGFYGSLADTLCSDETFAEPRDQRCWNGERIAEYTKTVVDVGLNMQKYNPEVKPVTDMQGVDPRIAHLVEKLRHVHHMAMSSIGTPGADVDYMQRDGFEGSGSGNGPDDENDDEYNPTGSGSGTGAIPDGDQSRSIDVINTDQGNKNPDGRKPSSPSSTGGSLPVKSSKLLLCLILFVFMH